MSDSLSYTDSEQESLLDPEEILSASIRIEDDGSIDFSPPITRPAQTFEDVVAVLDHCKLLTEIMIEWQIYTENIDFRLMLQWMKVAAKLHVLPSLQSIILATDGLEHSFSDMFFDSLPDKLFVLFTEDLRTATLLRKRKAEVKCVYFHRYTAFVNEHPYFADLFRVKATHIELSLYRPVSGGLRQLRDSCPIDHNEHLQVLHISGTDDIEARELQTLRLLRAINAHFKFQWNDVRWLSLNGSSDLKQVDDVKIELMEIATTLRDAGFRSTNDVMQVRIFDRNDWKDVSRDQVMERLGWKREELTFEESIDFTHACSLVHNGVRIVMKISKW